MQVLSTFAVVSFFGFASCNHYPAIYPFQDRWTPFSQVVPRASAGRQMPPHYEPDAVLINTRGSRGYENPGTRFPDMPTRPGIFGIPYGPRGPNEHGIYGVPAFGRAPSGDMPYMPGGFAMPDDRPYMPTVFGIPPGPPNVHPAFSTPERRGPMVFADAGTGNIPFHGFPALFVPNFPGVPENYPDSRAEKPNRFLPGRKDSPREILPGIFYPQPPLVPVQANEPSKPKSKLGENEGREMIDEPIAALFPMVEKSP